MECLTRIPKMFPLGSFKHHMLVPVESEFSVGGVLTGWTQRELCWHLRLSTTMSIFQDNNDPEKARARERGKELRSTPSSDCLYSRPQVDSMNKHQQV